MNILEAQEKGIMFLSISKFIETFKIDKSYQAIYNQLNGTTLNGKSVFKSKIDCVRSGKSTFVAITERTLTYNDIEITKEIREKWLKNTTLKEKSDTTVPA